PNTPLEAGLGGIRRYDQFERMQLYANIQRPPPVKFRDLEAIVDSTIEYNTPNFTSNVTYVQVTGSTSLASITSQVQTRDLLFEADSGLHRATMNIFGRVTTLTRRVETHFEDTVSLTTSPALLSAEAERSSIYNKVLPLAPGKYRLELVVKDVIGETV